MVANDSEGERAAGIEFVRGQIGFYASTPAYRPVLELHGWGGLQEELNQLTRQGAWDRLADLIDDEILGTTAFFGLEIKAVLSTHGYAAADNGRGEAGNPGDAGSGVRTK